MVGGCFAGSSCTRWGEHHPIGRAIPQTMGLSTPGARGAVPSTTGEADRVGVLRPSQPDGMGLTDVATAVAESQCGVVTRRQLLEAGVSRETLRWRVGRDWRLLLPGVYVLQTGLPTGQQRLVAAQLLAGEGAWLAGPTAAALHGITTCRLGMPVRVLVPAPRRSRRVAWVDIRSTTLLGEPVIPRGPLRVGCLSRAVVDAAAETADERGARALVIEAVQRRLVRLDDLEHWVDARGRPGPSACVACWPRWPPAPGRCPSQTCSR